MRLHGQRTDGSEQSLIHAKRLRLERPGVEVKVRLAQTTVAMKFVGSVELDANLITPNGREPSDTTSRALRTKPALTSPKNLRLTPPLTDPQYPAASQYSLRYRHEMKATGYREPLRGDSNGLNSRIA